MRGKYEKYGKNLRILHLSADAPISARWNGNGLVNYQMRKTSAIDTTKLKKKIKKSVIINTFNFVLYLHILACP